MSRRSRGKRANANINASWGVVLGGPLVGKRVRLNHFSPKWGGFYVQTPDGGYKFIKERNISIVGG